jgi:hypothetical protein
VAAKERISDGDIESVIADQFSEEELEELGDRFDICEHDRKLRCDACLSREWDKGRKDGFETGFTWVIAQIKERCGKLYADGNEEKARILRDLSNNIVELAEKQDLIPKKKR